MKDYKITDDLSTPSNNNPQPSLDPDAKVRQVLAYGTLLLAFSALAVYAITRDLGILGESTIVGVSVILVFTYYFKRKKSQ